MLELSCISKLLTFLHIKIAKYSEEMFGWVKLYKWNLTSAHQPGPEDQL